MPKYLEEAFSKFGELSIEVIIALAVLAVLVVLLFVLGKRKWNTRTLTMGGICIALSFILSCIKLYTMPQGGSVTPCSMLPIMFFAVVAGPVYGMGAGLVYGVLQLLQDMYIVHPIQLLLDYLLAFTALGLAGVFGKKFFLGFTLASVSRFFCHFLAGIIFYASFAPEGMSPALYSLAYNGTFILPELVLCLLVCLIKPVRRTMDRLYTVYRPKKTA